MEKNAEWCQCFKLQIVDRWLSIKVYIKVKKYILKNK